MREAMKGFDFNRALDVLQELGALAKPGADGKRARPLRIGGQRPVRLYPINPDKLTGAIMALDSLLASLKSGVTEVTGVQASRNKAFACNPASDREGCGGFRRRR